MRTCIWESLRNHIDDGDNFYCILLSAVLLPALTAPTHRQHAPSLAPWAGLTRAAESSASGRRSSTLWSTARRAQREPGEAVTRRLAGEAGRLRAGLKCKPTCRIKGKVIQDFLYFTILPSPISCHPCLQLYMTVFGSVKSGTSFLIFPLRLKRFNQ